jgi:hypothetical protein
LISARAHLLGEIAAFPRSPKASDCFDAAAETISTPSQTYHLGRSTTHRDAMRDCDSMSFW